MTQPLSNQLPTQYTGQNFAPVKPILALQEANGISSPYSKHYLADALKEKYTELIKRDEESWKEMVSVGQLIALFIEGKQILDWNPYSNAFTPRKLKNSDPNKIKAVNFMQYYCSNWQAKWGSSNPDIVISPLSNRDQDIAKAKRANMVVNHLERKMYDSWYNYHEGMMAQVFGWYGNRVRPSDKNGRWALKPIVEEVPIQIGQGWGKCHDCEYSGVTFNSVEGGAESMPVCPQCGSAGVYYEPPVNQLMPQVTGEEKIFLPDIIAEQLPFPACRWNPKFRAEESSWFIYEQEVELGTIRRALGNVRLPEGYTSNEIGMDVMRTLGRTGAPLGGRSDVPMSSNKDNGLVTEMYLSANDLHDIKIEGDEDTVDGQKLPRGARASEMFPDGCCAVGINGMSLLVGLYAEHHSNSVTSGVYHMKPLSGTGRGVADAVEVQKRFNRFDSQTTTWMAKKATPATLHVAGAIKESDRRMLGRSDVDIPVNLQNFPEVRSLRDLVYPLSGESVPGDMLQYTYQHLQNFMQLAYHTTNLGGAPTPSGIQNNTATYAEIADANSESLFTPTLSIKANVRLDTARKAFELWCNTSPVPRFLPFDRAAKSGARGMDISGEDVKGEYEWSVVPGSELPKTKLSKRKDSMQFYAMFGGIPAYLEAKTAAPQDVAEIERVFDMDLASDNYDDIGEICRTRFENLKEIWGQAEQMRGQAFEQFGVEVPQPDPLMLLEEVKPSLLITESHLPEKALWFSNLLDTGEGQVMEDAERNLVSALAQGMMMLAKGQAIEIATGEAEVMMSGQAPMMEAQAQQEAGAMEAETQQKQADMESKQAENQMKLDADMEREGMKAATEMMKIKAQADTRAYPKNEGKSAAKKK